MGNVTGASGATGPREVADIFDAKDSICAFQAEYSEIAKMEASPWLSRYCKDHGVILGSSSEWRKQVLVKAGCRLTGSVSPDIDEKAFRGATPTETALMVARAKLAAVKDGLTKFSVVVCSDQVAVCKGELREKPADEEQARLYIKSYGELLHPVETVTAIVVYDALSGLTSEGSHTAKVQFKAIPAEDIDAIVADKVIYTCAGGFSVDDPLMGKFVHNIEGGMDSVMGMPLLLLERLLKDLAQKAANTKQ